MENKFRPNQRNPRSESPADFAGSKQNLKLFALKFLTNSHIVLIDINKMENGNPPKKKSKKKKIRSNSPQAYNGSEKARSFFEIQNYF